ncbi:transposase [Oscillatoriales cyanobacterium USR001]|nr:transposase [Oscillatoriales cyanobacterium USR001]
MYEYRKLSAEEKAELVRERRSRGFPPHEPPHPVVDKTFYLLTAACYEHRCYLNSEVRRQELIDLLFEAFIQVGMEIQAWVILPNHYHLLIRITEFEELSKIFRSVHGRTSCAWNLEDNSRGRKVWYRYSDRAIRSERHYYTTLNYIHYNPVKHGYVNSPYDWVQSSVHWYLSAYERQWLRDLWVNYPVKDYGKNWDDFISS